MRISHEKIHFRIKLSMVIVQLLRLIRGRRLINGGLWQCYERNKDELLQCRRDNVGFSKEKEIFKRISIAFRV